MDRGKSSGGGQSSLGYLFGGGEPNSRGAARSSAPPAERPTPVAAVAPTPAPVAQSVAKEASPRTQPASGTSLEMGGKLGRSNNNYFRADGQNSGNFITDRPSTRVHSAPGGGSSLGYLFGG
ncbi:hypothetical protein CBR_g30321 [Chara braunii]|uniref:Protein SPIRAL1-like 1 n=1 Tax=Chara braunii TaxID=69332 RepID=A0A388JX69_CHABU|nr:hypothetical protein CBR_g30321 [Chara braunii]|eukprot:GBG62367.1 hypothetical protein CBR_g30321 [Chara braunii]